MKQLSLVLILVMASAAAWTSPSRADSGLRLVAESAEPCAEPCDRAAVVFIHGYTGARETWTSGQAYWPALLAGDSDLNDRLDIYSVVYDSFLFSGPPISEVVADLEKELDALMLQMRYAKVIFICQSLGGIVARQYLLHVKNRYGHTVLGHFRPLGRIEVGQGFPKHSSAQTKRHLDRGSRRTPPSYCENADALVQLFSGSIDLRRPVADPCVREEASVTPAPSIWPIHSPDHRLATSRKCDRG